MLSIKINPRFYDALCIQETINEFNEICDASFDGTTLFLNPKGDIPNLQYEFLNYVLGLMKNKGLV